jgi:hypothetical protein
MNSGLIVAVAVLVAATIVGVLWRSRQGRLRAVAAPAPASAGPASLLLFTTPTCTTCRQVRAVCAGIEGVHLTEVDATAETRRARSLDVWRAPTLFVLDAAGRPAWRTTGVPSREDLQAAIDATSARAAAPPAPAADRAPAPDRAA